MGQTISHYRTLENVGEGGMGMGYKAEDLRPNRACLVTDGRRFTHEGRHLSSGQRSGAEDCFFRLAATPGAGNLGGCTTTKKMK